MWQLADRRTLLRRGELLVALATFALILSGDIAPPSGASTTRSIYVSLSGDDGNPGTAVLPVSSFNPAYRLAKPGETVIVSDGRYPYQQLQDDPSKRTTKDVTFRPAQGATVSIDSIDFGQDQTGIRGAKHVTIANMSVGYLRSWSSAEDLTWRNITGKHFDVIGTKDVTIHGGTFGPCTVPQDDPICVPRIAGAAGVVMEGTTIRGMVSTDLAKYHVDGLFLMGSKDVQIRDTKFIGNMVTHIRIQNIAANAWNNADITIQNSWFDAPLDRDGVKTRADAIDVDNAVPNLLIQNNSFSELAGPFFFSDNSGTNTRVIGNLYRNFGCSPGVTYRYNLIIPFSAQTGTSPCGTTDRVVSTFRYADLRGFDYHLLQGSAALRVVRAGNCAAFDIDGQKRFPGRKCDAGADQRIQTICHRTGSHPVRRRALDIDPTRWPALRAHGDTPGPCPKKGR